LSEAISYQGLECNSEELIAIIKDCINNERTAQERLYKMFYPKMMAMIKRYFSDQMIAEEIINNGFLKAFKHVGSFGFKGSFEGWLRKIMFHSISDYAQVQNKYTSNIVLLEKDMFLPKTHAHNLYYKDLMKLVDMLPDATRMVFNLYVIENFGHKEIGKLLNISEGTSKWHLSEARKILKAKIEKLNLHTKTN
jgi:RNA polymerase sigma factor (sigma-70 family)